MNEKETSCFQELSESLRFGRVTRLMATLPSTLGRSRCTEPSLRCFFDFSCCSCSCSPKFFGSIKTCLNFSLFFSGSWFFAEHFLLMLAVGFGDRVSDFGGRNTCFFFLHPEQNRATFLDAPRGCLGSQELAKLSWQTCFMH